MSTQQSPIDSINLLGHTRPTSVSLLFELLADFLSIEREEKQTPESMAIELMRYFSPTTIRFPLLEDIEAFANERLIARRVSADPSSNNVTRLCQFLSMDTREVGDAFKGATGRRISEVRKKELMKKLEKQAKPSIYPKSVRTTVFPNDGTVVLVTLPPLPSRHTRGI